MISFFIIDKIILKQKERREGEGAYIYKSHGL
jgi:hypothetical protein